MRLIDIDAFRKDWGLAERCEDCERDARGCQYDQIYTRMDFCGWLDDAEIIDAVQVVRCKDCKWWRDDNPRVNGYHCCYRMHNIFPMKESDFCSYGERKTAESE